MPRPCPPYQASASQLADHPSLSYSEVQGQILWLVDEYVMKSELCERLLPIIERVHTLSPHSDKPFQRTRAA